MLALQSKLGFDCSKICISGKIWVFWNSCLHCSFIDMAGLLAHIQIEFPSSISISISMVYAKCNRTSRQELWVALEVVASIVREPWIVAGDFNIITAKDKCLGGATPRLVEIEEFNETLQSCDISILDFDGARHTWTNRKVWQRLDRALVNVKWREEYDNFHYSHLTRGRSNDCSLFI